MKSITKLKDDARRLEQREDWEKAIQVYLQVLRLASEGESDTDLPLYNRVGDLFIRIGRQPDAVNYYEQAADRYAEAGLFNNAIALCNKALRHAPDRVDLLRKLGRFSASQGFLTDARRYFLDYAERQFAAGAIDDALGALSDFARVADDAEVWDLLGRRLQAHGRIDDAVDALRQAWSLLRESDPVRAGALRAEITRLAPDSAFDVDEGPGPAPRKWKTESTEHADPLPGLIDIETGRAEEAADEPDTAPLEGLEPTAFDVAPQVDTDPMDIAGFEIESFEGATDDIDAVDPAAQDSGADSATRFDSGSFDLPELETGFDGTLESTPAEEVEPGTGPDVVDFSGLEDLEITPYEEPAQEADPALPAGSDHEAVGAAETRPPKLDDELPTLEDESPAFDQELPTLEDESPALDHELPTLDDEPPAPEDELPALEDESPAFDHELPTLDESPALDHELPTLDDEPPAPEDELPRPEDESPALEDEMPTLEDELPTLDESPALDHELPTLDDEPPALEEDVAASSAEADLPSLEIGPPAPAAEYEESPGEPDLHMPEYEPSPPRDEGYDSSWEQARPGLQEDGAARADVEPMPGLEEEAAMAEPSPVQPLEAGSEFVDLGALLAEDEEGREEGTRFRINEATPTGDEDRDFAELLSQFKAKVSEHVPPEDAASHYDLGLAFKEMGLVNEAIAEFQIALRSGTMRLKVWEELGQCFLQKQEFNIAEKVARRALEAPYDDELELLGVYYVLGRAYEAMGRSDEARDAYERVLGLDLNFQDVSERLQRL